jgi:aminoglycoside N3'-acetyltransferase
MGIDRAQPTFATKSAQSRHKTASAFLSLWGAKQTCRGHDEIDAFDPARPFASLHDSGGSIPRTARHSHALS